MTMTVFESHLADRRDRFNSAFAAARMARPRLDGAAFLGVLREAVAPVAEAAIATQPDRAALIVEALYDLALDLFRQDLLGSRARSAAIPLAWSDLLPKLGDFVAIDPLRAAASISNAAYNLERVPEAGATEWMARLLQVAALTPSGDLDALLRGGQVAAWRSGMAHYRASALAACDDLAEPLARAALGLDPSAPFSETLARLRADRWYLPGEPARESPRVMGEVGGFRGLGGPFLTLPRLAVDATGLLVRAGDRAWRLNADAFGATLLPLHPAPDTNERGASRAWSLKPDGALQIDKRRAVLPVLADSLSNARFEDTVAVVTAWSYKIKLVAV